MRGPFHTFSLSSDCWLEAGHPTIDYTRQRCPIDPHDAQTMPFTSMSLSVLLLGFARLSAADRKAFLTQLNQFILASPHQRRSKIQSWEEDGGASAAARAEPLEKPM